VPTELFDVMLGTGRGSNTDI